MAGKSFTKPPLSYDSTTFNRILQDIATRIKEERPLSPEVYAITTPGTDTRTLDVTAATLADVKAFLSTLVRDLQASGRLARS